MTEIRVCFIGDSITNGTDDAQALGWPGRLCAGEWRRGHRVTHYNLGVRGDTSELIRARWRREARARLPDNVPGRLLFAFGVNDTAHQDGKPRVTPERAIDNARAMLEEAAAWLPAVWVGPAPIDEARQPLSPAPGVEYHFDNARIQAANAAYAALAANIGIPYLDLFTPLAGDPAWASHLAGGDGVHPPAEGYARLAALVDSWAAWRFWLEG